MKTLAKVGIGCAGVVAVASVGIALVAPKFIREAGQFVAPIQEMKRRQTALEEMVREVGWKRPERDALSKEQLDRFFAVRRRVDAGRTRGSTSCRARTIPPSRSCARSRASCAR